MMVSSRGLDLQKVVDNLHIGDYVRGTFEFDGNHWITEGALVLRGASMSIAGTDSIVVNKYGEVSRFLVDIEYLRSSPPPKPKDPSKVLVMDNRGRIWKWDQKNSEWFLSLYANRVTASWDRLVSGGYAPVRIFEERIEGR